MNKLITTLVLIFSGLALLFALHFYLNNKKEEAPPFFTEVSTDDVTQLEVIVGNEITRLTKTDKGWTGSVIGSPGVSLTDENKKDELTPTQFEADAENVKLVINKLIDLERETLISSNPESFSTYQTTDLAPRVSLFDKTGKNLGTLYLGKNGPAFLSGFVRFNKENEVYLLSESIKDFVLKPVEGWKKREETTAPNQ